MIGPGSANLHGQLRLSEAADTVIAGAGSWVKVEGTFIDGEHRGFDVDTNTLVYTGPSGACFLFNGTSDLASNKACTMQYSLYVNGEAAERGQTPHTFPASARTSTIAITALLKLNQGDVLEVYATSDQAATTLSIKTLNITFWGN